MSAPSRPAVTDIGSRATFRAFANRGYALLWLANLTPEPQHVAIAHGADVVRVHDVKAMHQVAQMTDAIYRHTD